VRVTCARYLGTIHDFVMLNAIADTPAAARRNSAGHKRTPRRSGLTLAPNIDFEVNANRKVGRRRE
jgi:hypothetical protein